MSRDGPSRSIKKFYADNVKALTLPTAPIVQLVTQYHVQHREEELYLRFEKIQLCCIVASFASKNCKMGIAVVSLQ